jgi:leader peptidase (prepilin peptidase)/N-methyltransferase
MLVAAIVVAGLLSGASLWRFGFSWTSLPYIAYGVLSGVLIVIDARSKRLPNALTLPAIPVTAALLAGPAIAGEGDGALLRAICAGTVLLLAYLALHLISPAGLGPGDVKLAASMGMVLGWISWPALLWGAVLGFVIAALVSLALLAARRATRKSDVPFGPSMLAGAWVVIIASSAIPL